MNAAHSLDDAWTTLEGQLDDGYTLCVQLAMHVYPEGDEWVASLEDVPINAFGVSEADAVARLRHEIVGHLRWLEDAGDKLSPPLMRERDQLRSIVQTSCA